LIKGFWVRIELTITEYKAYYYGYEINYNQTKQQNVPYKLNKLKQEIPIRNWFLEKKNRKLFTTTQKTKTKKKESKWPRTEIQTAWTVTSKSASTMCSLSQRVPTPPTGNWPLLKMFSAFFWHQQQRPKSLYFFTQLNF